MISDAKRNWFIYLLLVVITLAVYSRVTRFDFVFYDDGIYVTGNDHVKAGLAPHPADELRWNSRPAVIVASAHTPAAKTGVRGFACSVPSSRIVQVWEALRQRLRKCVC